MFCLDVKALYPSVPRLEARDACEQALKNRTNPTIPTECVLEMLDLVLENNHFSFNGKNFIQTEGTAIGSHLGMNYASTYLGEWEMELFKNSQFLPAEYWRYVDDVWGIWEHGLEKLQEFHNLANSLHPRIQTELRFSTHQISFLDVDIKLVNGVIQTDIFSKDTDKHMYLHVTSNHPNSVKNAIPYGLGIRAKRICSEAKDYKLRHGEITEYLQKRGYSRNTIDNQLSKVKSLDRTSLLKYNTRKQNTDLVPLFVTYSNGLPNIH